tara:strand:+ start:85 stop:738 length:654 start_codon:yes stop_codon:yes gene_type:complete
MNFAKNRINQILFLAIIIFAIIAGWSVSELFKKEDSSNDIRVNFNLTNHLGAKVSEKDYQKYSKVFFFGFTYCPDICPISANLIANAIDELKDEQFSTDGIKFFFVTVDPRRDTPRRLNEFLDSFNSEIIGLTGSQKELLPIWKDFFVHVEPSIDSQHQTNLNQADQDIDYEPEIENYMVQHTAFFYIFDKDNTIQSILPFGSSIEQLKKELKIVGQ